MSKVHFIGPTHPLLEDSIITTSTIEDVVEYCSSKSVLGLDTETTGLDFMTNRVIMVQIGDAENVFVIDARYKDITSLLPILASRSIIKILANAKFDYKMLKSSYGIELENIYDVMLGDISLTLGIKSYNHDLKSILKRTLGIDVSKEERGTFIGHSTAPFTTAQVLYGANDISHLVPLREAQSERVSELERTIGIDLTRVIQLENDACLAYGDIEFNGFTHDPEPWKVLANEAEHLLDLAKLQIDKIVEEDPMFRDFLVSHYQRDLFIPDDEIRKVDLLWSSPTKVLKLFQKIDPTLEGINAKTELEPRKHLHPLIKAYIKYKEHAKLVSSYGHPFFKHVKHDGRIHTSFYQIVETGRISSSSPNMQQIPADNRYRNCFIPSSKDYVMVSADYASQELCIIAYGAKDPVWLEALQKGKDLHSVCADLVFGQKWKDVAEEDCLYMVNQSKCECSAHKSLRTSVKTINFG